MSKITLEKNASLATANVSAATSRVAGNTAIEFKGRTPIRISFFQPVLTLFQLLADATTIVLSFWSAYLLWNKLGPVVASNHFAQVPFSQYYFSLGVTILACLIGFQVNGLYQAQRSILNIREYQIILKTWLVACGVTMAILFLSQHQFYSRGVFALSWSFILLFMFFQRAFLYRIQGFLRNYGVSDSVALIYGAGEIGQKLLEKFNQSPKLGYQIAGFIDDDGSLQEKSYKNVPVLGDFSQLAKAIQSTGASKLFVAEPQIPQIVVQDLLKICRKNQCELQMVPSLYDLVIQRLEISEVDGLPLMGISKPSYSFRTAFFKRAFDLSVSLLLLLMTLPLFVFMSLTIKLTSKGPVFFRQKRVGKDGEKFVFYKFRSMYTNAPVYAQTPQSGKDSRITPIGRFLRRSSLDELPQLWNVLKGDMSLVGPRPEMPFIVETYNEMQKQRLNVRPGITGLWQISPARKFAIHKNMDYDLYYINNQSFLLDMVILMRTGISCVVGVGAY